MRSTVIASSVSRFLIDRLGLPFSIGPVALAALDGSLGTRLAPRCDLSGKGSRAVVGIEVGGMNT